MSKPVWDRYPNNPTMELLKSISECLNKSKIKAIPCMTCSREFFVVKDHRLESEDVKINGRNFLINPEKDPSLHAPLTCDMHDDVIIEDHAFDKTLDWITDDNDDNNNHN